jgi:hypoxanthine phosphoribosyltransferase
MENYRLVPCISAKEVEQKVSELAALINHDYEGKSLMVIGILKGACIFLSDLVRRLSMPVEIDFVRLASYGAGSVTSGRIELTKDVELPIEGRHLLVVEDIVDTGTTLVWLLDYLRKRQPESVKICALVDKLERRAVEVPLDYVGIRVDKGFLVGYGLDFAEKHRNLPGIHEVEFLE